MKKFHSPFTVVAVMTAVALAMLSGCKEEAGKKAPSQVVARVNGKEITVHQLNFLLQRQQNPDNAMKQKALDSLIDQEILVQKAEEMKLDREPSVVQVVEQAKREILARAALDRLTSKGSDITAKQIGEYYAANPHRFSERKIYQLDNYVIEKGAFNDDLKAALDKVKSPAETEQLLQSRNIKFGHQEGKRPPEQIPPALLDRMAGMSPGDILILPENDKVLLVQLRDSTPAPVDQEKATPVIKQILANKNKGEAINSNIKALQGAAKIEYVQRFDDKAATAPAAGTPVENGSDALKEGLKGLK